jgi:hypothetical protein
MQPERMSWPPADDATLEAALSSLRTSVTFPPTPALSATVASTLGQRPLPSTGLLGRWRGWGGGLRLGRGLALAILLLLIVAAAAVAFGIFIGGLRITFAPGTPPPLPTGVVRERAFGNEIGLAAARQRAGFAILTPGLPALGAPDHVYYNDFPEGGTVALVWGTRDKYPVDPKTGVGIVVTEFRATVDRTVWVKMLYDETEANRTVVNGYTAYWVSGGYHGFFYQDANGHRVDTSLRLVGSALVWQQNGLVLRIEGAKDLETAATIARSLK